MTHTRVDDTHGDAFTVWVSQGSPATPSAAQLAALREAMEPVVLEREHVVDVAGRSREPLVRPAALRDLALDARALERERARSLARERRWLLVPLLGSWADAPSRAARAPLSLAVALARRRRFA